jgi:hypothetical protein
MSPGRRRLAVRIGAGIGPGIALGPIFRMLLDDLAIGIALGAGIGAAGAICPKGEIEAVDAARATPEGSIDGSRMLVDLYHRVWRRPRDRSTRPTRVDGVRS